MLDNFDERVHDTIPSPAPDMSGADMSFANVLIGTLAFKVICRRAYFAFEPLAETARRFGVTRQYVYRTLTALASTIHVETREEALAAWRAHFGP